MAKKKRTVKTSKKKKSLYKVETYGIKYDSLTFILFLAFVLLVSWLLVSKVL